MTPNIHDADEVVGRITHVKQVTTLEDYVNFIPGLSAELQRIGRVLWRKGMLVVACVVGSLFFTLLGVIAGTQTAPSGERCVSLWLCAVAISLSIAAIIFLVFWEVEKRLAMWFYHELSDHYEWFHRSFVVGNVGRGSNKPANDESRNAVPGAVTPQVRTDRELQIRMRAFLAFTSLPLAGFEHSASRYATVLLWNFFFNLALIVLLSVR